MPGASVKIIEVKEVTKQAYHNECVIRKIGEGDLFFLLLFLLGGEWMNHIIFFSGGKSSFATAAYVKEHFPDDNIILYFTDTLWEDEDLYRFIYEASDKLELPMLTHSTGITPIQLFIIQTFMGNSRVGTCSRYLKTKVSADYLFKGKVPKIEKWYNQKYLKDKDFVTDATLYFGISFEEMHRSGPILENWKPFNVVFPLIENIIDNDKVLETFNIKEPRLYKMGFTHNNCFHGSEKFITSEGIKTFKETVGRKVKVLGERANWQDAEIKCFGKQNIVDLHISRQNVKRVIKTTGNHRWFIRKSRDNRKEVLTYDLKPGDFLWSMHQTPPSAAIKPSSFAIAQGIVFGDGTRNATSWKNPASVTLCGEKVELLKFFPLSDQKTVDNIGIKVCDLPRTWKDLPTLDESKSFLLGWLVGYIAADGSVQNSTISLSSSKRKNLEFVEDLCVKIGISTNGIKVRMRKDISGNESELYSLTFSKTTFRKSFLIRKKHIENYGEELHIRHRPPEWKVDRIVYTQQKGDVYCAVVPKGEAFTLEGNIYTGNCSGRCVKAGQGHHRRLMQKMPEVFHKLMEQEIVASEYIRYTKQNSYHPDRDYMIQEVWAFVSTGKKSDKIKNIIESSKYMRKVNMGGRNRPYSFIKNLTLEELLERPYQLDLWDIGGCGCFTDFDFQEGTVCNTNQIYTGAQPV